VTNPAGSGPDRPDATATPASAPYFELRETPGGSYDPSGASIVNMDDYPRYEVAEGVVFCPVFGRNLSLNFVAFPPNSGFPTHVHPEEQISIVRDGEMEITVGDLRRWVVPGDVIVFPSNVPHSGRTLDRACRLIDIFSPPREGLREVIARADSRRPADIDRWWRSSDSPPA
jgi:quercetin dioxygenase-like cupin family protein